MDVFCNLNHMFLDYSREKNEGKKKRTQYVRKRTEGKIKGMNRTREKGEN